MKLSEFRRAMEGGFDELSEWLSINVIGFSSVDMRSASRFLFPISDEVSAVAYGRTEAYR